MRINWQDKQEENTSLIKGYIDFLPEVTNYDERLKLMTEIGRLNNQNKKINQMTVEDYKKETSNKK